eukprot:Gb_28571 [translate_table: standard]
MVAENLIVITTITAEPHCHPSYGFSNNDDIYFIPIPCTRKK